MVGNPPFGDEVKENDEDHLGTNQLANFEVANGPITIDSEQVIVERCIQFPESGGRLGLVLPDGLFNNQGGQSNCPQTRVLLAKRGKIEAIVSLPDHAFRKSGAQNKTSILFFRKFTTAGQRAFDCCQSRRRGKECDKRQRRFDTSFWFLAVLLTVVVKKNCPKSRMENTRRKNNCSYSVGASAAEVFSDRPRGVGARLTPESSPAIFGP